MFQDKAGFGRIIKPKCGHLPKGKRPSVPCHHIRGHRYAYGAVEPQTGESFFLVMPYCNTGCMNIFQRKLSMKYPNVYIILAMDGAAWHKSGTLGMSDNTELFSIPPATLEMNPIEQTCSWLRMHGFRNEIFLSLEKVVERLCETICSLDYATVKSFSHHSWIISTV